MLYYGLLHKCYDFITALKQYTDQIQYLIVYTLLKYFYT